MANAKKKTPASLRVLIVFLSAVGVLALCAVFWFLFTLFDRVSPLSRIRGDYGALVKTENLKNALEPLLDLQSVDTVLNEPALSSYRSAYLSLKQSSLRHMSVLASRKASVALYPERSGGGFVAVIDAGKFACITRLFSRGYPPFVKFGEIRFFKNRTGLPANSYVYAVPGVETVGNSNIYAKIYKNLIVLSSKEILLNSSFSKDWSSDYSASRRNLIEETCGKTFKIVTETKPFVASVLGNRLPPSIANLAAVDIETVLEVAVGNDRIEVEAVVPFDKNEVASSALATLLSRKSTMPEILTKLTKDVQSYSLVSAGTLSELKDASFSFAKDSFYAKGLSLDELWKQCEHYAQSVFGKRIEEFLFSWTGTEFAVVGMKDSVSPVFAVQVADEQKRAAVFDGVLRSLITQNDSNLIVGGSRLHRLEMPSVVVDLCKFFDIALSRPYYLVNEGYIYFSDSPQNLSVLYNEYKSNDMLAKSSVWQTVSPRLGQTATASLFYNLKRDVPFFLQGSGFVTRFLSCCNVGRCDFHIGEGALNVSFCAAAVDVAGNNLVSGFPVSLDGNGDNNLQAECPDIYGNCPAVFWTEDSKTVKSLELSSLQQQRLMLQEHCEIAAAEKKCAAGGVLWVVTPRGTVYLVDRKLSVLPGFPVMTSSRPSAKGAGVGTNLVVPLENGSVAIVGDNGTVQNKAAGTVFASQPSVNADTIAFYAEASDGIYLMKNGNFVNKSKPLAVSGPVAGTPCLVQEKEILSVACITNTGLFHLFTIADGEEPSLSTVQLDGAFSVGAVYDSGWFFALSDDGRLFRIGLDSSCMAVSVPDVTKVRSGCLSAKNGTVYVSAGDNCLHAFSVDLKLFAGFPLNGNGVPVFADADGDSVEDCILLSWDKKLYAWKMP